jgi:hypothetical protein
MRSEASLNLGGKGVMMTPEEIKEMTKLQKITESAVHPDTNEIVPFYMRMSGFVVFNTPILLTILFAKNQTPVFNAGMQIVNQTYNAGMNYGNRNASSEYSINDLSRGYFGAVAMSVSIALGSRTLLAKPLSTLKGPKYFILNAFLNYLAAATAGATNLALMRFKELDEGITVKSKDGEESFGKSKVAGKKAIYESALSRVVLPFPVIFFPSLALSLLSKLRLAPKGAFASKMVEFWLCVLSLTVSLPLSVALFKQQACLDISEVEADKFENAKNTNGEAVTKFYFNKGL